MPRPDHESNRAMWNEIVDVHYAHPSYKTREVLEGGSSLKQLEQAELGEVAGLTMLHLMCQFGLDSLSWARKGVAVTGVDISDRSIERANQLRAATGLNNARFIRSDVLELPDVLSGQFDIVYQSYGTLCWLADLRQWSRVVAGYLRPGGTLLLIDDHPCSIALSESNTSYFATEPEVLHELPDYADRSFIRSFPSTEWQHTTAEIINSLIGAGLRITKIGEYDYSYYQVRADWNEEGDRWYPPHPKLSFPLMLLVRATK